MLATRAADHGAHLFYVAQVGGQDELVFDGQSACIDPQGRLLARAGAFTEELLVVDLALEEGATARLSERPRRAPATDPRPALAVQPGAGDRPTCPTPARRWSRRLTRPLGTEEEVYRALVCATRDYVTKNGFDTVHIGLSGGIDSSLVAAVAADALGRERVVGVAMPSSFSSDPQPDRRRGAGRATSASGCSPCRSPSRSRRSWACSRSRSPAPSPAWPRRTSRPGCGARC